MWNRIMQFLYARGFDWNEWSSALHFWFSFLLVIVGRVFNLNIFLTAVIVFSLGVGKELYDYFIRKTVFSWNDLMYDFIGVCMGLLFCMGRNDV